jgi:hypothetical protein
MLRAPFAKWATSLAAAFMTAANYGRFAAGVARVLSFSRSIHLSAQPLPDADPLNTG